MRSIRYKNISSFTINYIEYTQIQFYEARILRYKKHSNIKFQLIII